jgi:hypothetical protein
LPGGDAAPPEHAERGLRVRTQLVARRQSLVYATWRDDSQGQIRRRDLASGKETVLVKEPGKYLEPRLSPDGKRLVFRKVRGGGLTTPWNSLETGLYLAAADGSGAAERIAGRQRRQFAPTARSCCSPA